MPELVEREAASRPEEEAGQVEPARLVPRALEPLIGQVAERLPEGAQGRGRPLVARHVEDFFEPLDQPRRARVVAGSAGRRGTAVERQPDRRDRRVDLGLLDHDPVGLVARHRIRRRQAGRPARGAGSGAASGGRRCATGTRARSCRPR